jgi:hypothetical protein
VKGRAHTADAKLLDADVAFVRPARRRTRLDDLGRFLFELCVLAYPSIGEEEERPAGYLFDALDGDQTELEGGWAGSSAPA